jgi:Mg2+ and Co2+ transporter CorA
MNSIRSHTEELLSWLENEEDSKNSLLRKFFDLADVPDRSLEGSNSQYKNVMDERLESLQRKCQTCINILNRRLKELDVMKEDMMMKSDCREQYSRKILAYNAVVTIACNVGVYLTGLFGMNLDNWDTLAPIKNGFLYLNLAFAAGMIIIFGILFAYVYTSFLFPTEEKKEVKTKAETEQVKSSATNIFFEYKVIRREECSPSGDASAQ